MRQEGSAKTPSKAAKPATFYLMKPFRSYAHAIIMDGKIYRRSIINIDTDGVASVVPFSTETEATEAFNGVIIVVPEHFTPSPELEYRISANNFTETLSQLATEVPYVGNGRCKLVTIEF